MAIPIKRLSRVVLFAGLFLSFIGCNRAKSPLKESVEPFKGVWSFYDQVDMLQFVYGRSCRQGDDRCFHHCFMEVLPQESKVRVRFVYKDRSEDVLLRYEKRGNDRVVLFSSTGTEWSMRLVDGRNEFGESWDLVQNSSMEGATQTEVYVAHRREEPDSLDEWEWDTRRMMGVQTSAPGVE